MEKYSLKRNRINAFIYIEDEFYSDNLHTECVTAYLKKKKLITRDSDLYKMLSDDTQKQQARQWLNEIEYNCLFGEIALLDGEITMIIYDKLTDEGAVIMKKKAFEKYGITKIYSALYTGDKHNKFNYISL